MTTKSRDLSGSSPAGRAARFAWAAVVLALLFSGSASADYLEHYWNGREAYRNKKYRESVVFLDRAVKLQPQAGARVRWTGTHFETYLPHFHLGRALYELGLFDQALEVWGESERQGKVRAKANRRLYREMQQQLERLQQQRLPEELERMRRDIEDTVVKLAELQSRGIGGLAGAGGNLERAATLLDDAREEVSVAEGQRTFEPLGKVGRALHEARSQLLRALDQGERRRRELRREADARRIEDARRSLLEAKTTLAGGACRPAARTLLLQVLAGGALPADLRTGPDSLPVLLSLAHEQCGDLLGAEQFLGLASEVGGARQRIAEARLQSMLEHFDRSPASAGCDVSSIALLEELNDRIPVGLRLARSYAACGLADPADEALGAVAAAPEQQRSVLLQRIARLRLSGDPDAARGTLSQLQQARRERKEERALSAYLLARARVDRRGCDRLAIASMHEAIPDLPGPADPGLVLPDLDLARAYRACGDRQQTRSHLDRARAAGQGTRDDIQQLTSWLKRTEALDIYSESYALLVGVADYQAKGWGPLPEVLEDLNEVAGQLGAHGFAVQKLIDPSHDELTKALTAFFGRKRRPDSRLIFYYGGHGHTEVNEYLRLGYIVPADTPFPADDPDARYLDYLVSMDGFDGFARQTAANHAMFLFDSCFSGTIFDAVGSRIGTDSGGRADPAKTLAQPVRLFVTAGDETERVPADSVFRAAVVRALEGFADADTDGLILGAEVGSFVARHGASPHNTPKWGVLDADGFDSGDMVFRIPDFAALPPDDGASASATAAELALWRLVSASPDSGDLQRYLERYPEGRFARAAAWMIRRRSR